MRKPPSRKNAPRLTSAEIALIKRLVPEIGVEAVRATHFPGRKYGTIYHAARRHGVSIPSTKELEVKKRALAYSRKRPSFDPFLTLPLPSLSSQTSD